MYLLFLYDPHAPTISLKPSAERLLGIAPEEQDKMVAWILANVPAAARKPSTAGAYISECPYQIVRPYHKGDLVRTERLFKWLWPRIEAWGMREAYERDLRLAPVMLRNSRMGMPVDVDGLARDLPRMEAGIEAVDAWLRRRLGDINFNSDRQLGKALKERGVVKRFALTAKGQASVSKKNLTIDKFSDPQVYQALTYRGQMATSVDTFMRPWLEMAGRSGGLLHPSIAQVRTSRGSGTAGARSGRIIYFAPNLTNIPKKWKKAVAAGYVHPSFAGALPELPFMRSYCLPRKRKQWGRRDWNQQEVRLFAHFEEGPVAAGFKRDPRYDMHESVRAEEEAVLVASGLRESFDRDSAKGTVFAGFYGQGIDGLMELLKLPDDQRPVAVAVQQALRRAAPSIKELSDALSALARDGLPIRTWGGRLYWCEPPMYSARFGRDMTFEYKLISYLIQGSGADVAKEALVRWDAHPGRHEELLATVYDEINIDLPLSARGAQQEMRVLKECMESIECGLPMLSDGEKGPSWGRLERYEV